MVDLHYYPSCVNIFKPTNYYLGIMMKETLEENTYVHDRNNDRIPKNVINVHASTGIKRLHVGAVRDNVLLQSITLPETLQLIGSFAFHGCQSLTTITIPSSVTLIGDSAFHSCSSLEKVTIENHQQSSLEKIGFEAFRNCSSLTAFDFPKSSFVKKIDSWFSDCVSLQKIEIPDTIEVIGYNAFRNCTSLKYLLLPSSVEVLDSNAFFNCTSLRAIYVPESLREIGKNVFCKCSSLVIIAFPSDFRHRIWNINTFFGIGLLDSPQIRSYLWLQHAVRFDGLPLHRFCYQKADSLTFDSFSTFIGEKNNKDQITSTDDLGMTPLHILCCNPNTNLDMINQLISFAPNVVNMKNVYGMTPLMLFLACHSHDFHKASDISKRWPLSNLAKRGGDSGLYPFMAAASTKSCRLEEVYLTAVQLPGLIKKMYEVVL